MTDAFAQAAQQAAEQAQQNAPAPAQATAVQAPVGNPVDLSNPWVTSTDVPTGGGDWDPRVPFEEIVGRTVAMIVREYDPQAKNPFYKTTETPDKMFREEIRVDMAIVDGDPFSYEITKNDPNDSNKKIYQTITIDSVPYVARRQSVAQGQLIGKLKGVVGLPRFNAPKTIFTDTPRLYVGVVSYAPFAGDARNGKTIEHVTAEMNEWVARGRKGTEPDRTFVLDDRKHVIDFTARDAAGNPSDPRVIALNAWWAEYSKTL
jgi:hypothetical protein